MATVIPLILWVFLSYVLYTCVAYLITHRKHTVAARALGCRSAPGFKTFDPFGIKNVSDIVRAGKECRVPSYLKERVDEVCLEQGQIRSTFSQRILGKGSIFTVDPKNVQAILATKFKDFELGPSRNNNFSPLLGRGIFSSDGQEWSHSRALLRPQFTRDQISDLELEERHVRNLMGVLPLDSHGWTDAVDLQPLFFRLTIDSATEFLFGESIDSQLFDLSDRASKRRPMVVSEKEFAVSFDKAQATLAEGVRYGDKYWFAHDREFRKHCSRCHAFIDHYVQIALSKKKEKDESKSIPREKQRYVFLDAVANSTSDPIELRYQMLNILLAGRDTTASLLGFVFMLLTRHPDVYAKLRSIVIRQFGTYIAPKDITFTSLKNCSYLQWILNETLRLYPVVPLDGRRAAKDTTLPTGGGSDGTAPIYIRAGQQVDYSVYVMHRRKDLWGPDADEFRPERWDGRKVGWEYLPFNGGPRICIGQQFALTEAGYVIMRLCQRFEKIEGVENAWDSGKAGSTEETRVWLTLTGCPADGVKVRMKMAGELV
ncbi:hypothetical protein N0V95_002064 [Ascochyta clinopodiicola]|nr:hypothetical protein N0V95_002064 [Ascochyta clinopodiicola]